jgi:dethiobiotin synthetase
VFKPVALGCPRRIREGLVCPDAEFLAHCADVPHEVATVNPARFAYKHPPPPGTERPVQAIDHAEIERCRKRIARDSDLVLIDTDGGLLAPLDQDTRVVDFAVRWRAPLIVVGPAAADQVGQTLLTLEVARQHGLDLAAVVLNRYHAEGSTLADETNPEFVAAYGGVSLPTVIPHDAATDVASARIGQDVLTAVTPLARLISTRE